MSSSRQPLAEIPFALADTVSHCYGPCTQLNRGGTQPLLGELPFCSQPRSTVRALGLFVTCSNIRSRMKAYMKVKQCQAGLSPFRLHGCSSKPISAASQGIERLCLLSFASSQAQMPCFTPAIGRQPTDPMRSCFWCHALHRRTFWSNWFPEGHRGENEHLNFMLAG